MDQEYVEYLNGKLREFKYLYIEDVTEELVARNIKDILDSLSVEDIKQMLLDGFGGFLGIGDEAIYKTRFKIEINQLHFLASLNEQHKKRILESNFKEVVR